MPGFLLRKARSLNRSRLLMVFDLALDDDHLLLQEGVLGNEPGLAAHRILGGPCEQ